MKKLVIGLVGPIASGKGTVVGHLSEKGYVAYSFSNLIKEEIKKRGLEITRFTLNEVSNDLRQKEGIDIWARKMAKAIDQKDDCLVVLDGARNPLEIAFLKEKYGAFIIGITAEQGKRFEMFKKRNLENEKLLFDEFKKLDDRELKQEGEFAQQVNKCLELADVVIENNGTIQDLNTKVDDSIASFYAEK